MTPIHPHRKRLLIHATNRPTTRPTPRPHRKPVPRRPHCNECGEKIRYQQGAKLPCACERTSETDPTPEELAELQGLAILALVDDDDAEVARRLAMPDGQEHAREIEIVPRDRKASELTTMELCGVVLDATVFMRPVIAHSPTSAYHQSDKRPSARAAGQKVRVVRAGHGCKDSE